MKALIVISIAAMSLGFGLVGLRHGKAKPRAGCVCNHLSSYMDGLLLLVNQIPGCRAEAARASRLHVIFQGSTLWMGASHRV